MSSYFRIEDWEGNFYSSVQISWHPIGARCEDFGVPIVMEIINPCMLEKPIDDADDFNVFTQAGHARTETADSAAPAILTAWPAPIK